MLMDIFSGFDDHNSVFMNFFYSVWMTAFLILFIVLYFVWVKNNSVQSLMMMLMSVVEDLVARSQAKEMGGSVTVFISLFVMLIILNLLGLVPYIFSVTSHLAVNLAIALPLWTSIVMMSFFYDAGSFLAHLQPMGSPAPLNPFLCIIELVSLLVRPITLSVRLTANLSTGHILMALLGVGFVNSNLLVMSLILVIGTFYFIFEMGVCFIQGYIFTLLPTLYADEHPSDNH